MDDQTILELIRTGKNDLALNALYRNFPAIRKLVRSRGGSTKDAEDVFQEALMILIGKVKKDFRLSARLSTYLYGVCHFLWTEQLRKRRQQVPFDPQAEGASDITSKGGLTVTEEVDLYVHLQHESRIRLAEQALNELKDRCRELLLIFYYSRLSLKEIAAKMGFGSENSAKNQKYKCLEAARTRLKELQHQTQTH
ncbi:MAG TPA: sigma-70 family RNA polymerase sigma factor [Puia sp.]|uniref:RNA polymerase sigma factor n=1 Tax=Puia sp. TaxID=2045100 RepID=UPI002B8B1FAC|nr:sigma-70 family RNA polymerase sigma factor [Puia sp.]HVU98426.1 sigma-70 family RNA polymerase sigma factor [Puia sp.]